MNSFIEDTLQFIRQRAFLHPNDPRIDIYWKDLTEILSRDIDKTIQFLETCSQDEIEYISEVFEDISYRVQSEEYIKCLERLDRKFPDADLADDIREAKEYML